MSHKVFVGIGTNHDREHNLRHGIHSLREYFGPLQLSSVYETEPVGQAHTVQYYNLVAGFDTDLQLRQVLTLLKKIEIEAGRRSPERCPLDVDLLLFGDVILHNERLSIPRKDITDYAYVAVPLAEIAGDMIHPETGKKFREHCQSARQFQQKIRPVTIRLSQEKPL